MSQTILQFTLCIEFGLVVGYCFAWGDRFITEGRAMVLGMLRAIAPKSGA